MGRGSARWFIVVLGVLAFGCDEEAPADAGGGDAGTMMMMDSGTDPDGGPEGDAGVDAGEPLPLGAACAEGSECESGACLNPTSALDLGTGFCSQRCDSDADCGGFPTDDGYTYECVAESPLVSRCHRACVEGFGCPEGAFCVNDFGFQAGPADICLDLTNDGCRSNADCADPERCTLLIDRERANQVCFAPRMMDGSPVPLRTVGDTCEPRENGVVPCDADADCPTGHTCETNAQGNDVCLSPVDERCHLLCIFPGVCSGLCDTDADCPTDMRCSRAEWPYIGHTPGVFDDEYVEAGFCTYAAGSRTSCVSEEDCASTGPGGAEEACWPTLDAMGMSNFVCVTPPAGYAREGEACGDDPTTDDTYEVRLCAAGACVNNLCGNNCDTAADCPAGWACQEQYIASSVTVRRCVDARGCAMDSECEAGEICQGILSTTTDLQRTCTFPKGALSAGDACEPAPLGHRPFAETCETGFCFGFPDGDACTQLCNDDADCPGADWLCTRFTQTLNNAGTFPDVSDDEVGSVNFCQPFPGSRSACTLSSDCPAGERCLGYVDRDGATQRVCITEIAGGGEVGDLCSADDPCAGWACRPDWLDPRESFCTGFCAADADCPGDWVCRNVIQDDPFFTEPICMPADDPRGTPL